MKNLYSKLCSGVFHTARSGRHSGKCGTGKNISLRIVLPVLGFTIAAAFSSSYVSAQNSGIDESYVNLTINGIGNTYYDLFASTGNPDFQGTNFGTFIPGVNTLVLNGARNQIHECGTADITSNNLFYRIYETATTPPAFSSASIPYVSDVGTAVCGGPIQVWESSGSAINVLSSLTAGTYNLELYTTASGIDGGPITHFADNGGANYIATFTVAPADCATGISVGPFTDQTLCIGGSTNTLTATITTTAGSPPGNITYEWFSNTVNSTSGGTSVQGPLTTTTSTTTDNFTPPSTPSGTLWYYCKVTNLDAACGGTNFNTATVGVTVNPNNTITLSSAAGTDAQTKCINTAITNITYSTTGATGATVTGLPTGVTGSWAGNVVTITGTPTALGTFNYTVTLTGGCGNITSTGSITVTSNNTITLTSAVGTNAQTVCINTAITAITYSTTGATGATVSGLPAGVAGSWAANVVTISGTPTASGTFNYTVTLTGGCGVVTATGTITVTANNAINLTSAAGTNTQTRCINTAITNITYSTTGATGATITGLPTGVTASWAANVVTISGTPTVSGTFNYTVTLTGGCGNITATGTITVTTNNTITLTSAAGTNAQTKCINTAITTITYSTTGATGATFSGLPAGVTGNWAANVVTINGTPSVAGTFNYTVTLTGGCGTTTATGTVTVNGNNAITLSSAVGTNNQSVCINTAITTITYNTSGATGATVSPLPAGVTGSWAGNVVTISGTPTATGTFNYTVTLTGGCGTVTSTGTIRVTAVPTPNICFTEGQDDNTYNISPCGISQGGNQNDLDIFSGDPGGSATYQWQVSFDNGVTWQNGPGPSATQNQFVLDPLYTFYETFPGTYKFRLIVTNNGCSGTSDVITLNVSGTSNLTPGSIGADQTSCSSSFDPAQLNQVTAATGGLTDSTFRYVWQSSTDGTNWSSVSFTTNTFYNPPVITQTTYYRRMAIRGGCSGISNVVTVALSKPATPGAISGTNPVCSGISTTYSITAVGSATSYNWTVPAGWTITSGAGTTSIIVTVGSAGGNISVTAQNSCGTSAASTLAVSVLAAPTTANAGADQNNCNNGSFTLAGNTPSVGTGLWSVVSGTASITTPTSATSGVTSVPAGTSATLRWTTTNGTCTTTDDVILTNSTTPTTSNAGPDQSKCNTSTFTLAGNTPAIGTGTWTVVSGTATITTPASATSGVTGVLVGTSATLRWTITNGACTSFDDVVLTNSALPTTAAAGPDQINCISGTFTLAGNAPVTGTGTWTVVTGTATIATPSSPTSGVTGVPSGTSATLRWTITNGACTSTDDVVLTYTSTPTTAAAGPDQTNCNNGSFTLAGNTPVTGTGTWTVVSGTATITTASSPTSGVTGVPAGTSATLRWTISNGTCTSTDDVILTNSALPTAANAGPDQINCINGTFTLAGNTPGTGTGTWTVVTGTATINTPSSPTSGVTGVPAGTSATLRWTITNGACTSTDDVVLTYTATPTTAAAGPDQTNCNNGSFTLAGNTPVTGTGTWTVVTGTATITTPSSPTSGVTGVPAGTSATLRWTISNGTCTSSDDVILTNNAPPTTTGVTICVGGSGLLSANSCFGSSGTAGPNNPGTGTNVTGVGTSAWANPNNIAIVGNASTGPINANVVTNYLQGSNYGFAIPGAATITGITVVINRNSTGAIPVVRDNIVSLVKAGVITGSNKAATTTDWPSTIGTASYGSSVDLWGTGWTPADINANNFGVVLSAVNANTANARQGNVDYIQISVSYTLPGNADWYTAAVGGTFLGSGVSFNPVASLPGGNTNTAGTYTFYAECPGAPGCRTATDFVINPRPTAVISGTTTICSGNSTTLTVTLTGTGPWNLTYSDGTTPTTVNNIASSPYTFNVSPTSMKTYTVTALSDSKCTAIAADLTGSAVVSIATGGAAGVWTGAKDNDWFNCANWGDGNVPTVLSDVTILGTATNPCRIDLTSIYSGAFGGVARCKNLTIDNNTLSFAAAGDSLQVMGNTTIQNSGTLDMTVGGTLELRGNWINNVVSGANGFKYGTGLVTFTGGVAQTVSSVNATELFYNLQINKTAGTVSLNKSITANHNLVLTKGVFVTNNNLFTWSNSGGTLTSPNTPWAPANTTYSDSYICTCNGSGVEITPTGSNGFRILNVSGSSDVYFPVGTDFVSANRMALNMNNQATADFTVVVGKGDLINTPQPRVNRIWYVNSSITDTVTIKATMKLFFTKRDWATYPFLVAQDEIETGYAYDDNHLIQKDYSDLFYNNSSGTDILDYLNSTFPYNTELYGLYRINISPDIYQHTNGIIKFTRFSVVNADDIILPVSIIDFKATQQGPGINLEWKTLNELNMDHYEIQKSTNGITFSSISSVTARNNNSPVNKYGGVDVKPSTGNNFYRIKAVDKSGEVSYTEVVVVKIGAEYASIRFYPNPVINKALNIQMNNMPAAKYTLSLYNTAGQKVFERVIEHPGGAASQQIMLPSTLANGGYLLKLFNETTYITTKLVID